MSATVKLRAGDGVNFSSFTGSKTPSCNCFIILAFSSSVGLKCPLKTPSCGCSIPNSAVIGITSIIRTLSIKSSEILSFDIYVMFAFSAVLGIFFFFPRKYKMYSIHGLFLLSAFLLYYFTLL